jgi:hypothetical protein
VSLSMGALAGIGVGCGLAGIAFIVGLVLFILAKRRANANQHPPVGHEADHGQTGDYNLVPSYAHVAPSEIEGRQVYSPGPGQPAELVAGTKFHELSNEKYP